MQFQAYTRSTDWVPGTTPSPQPIVVCGWQGCTNHATTREFQRCSVCKQKGYCSADHQKRDWKTHKFSCSTYPFGSDGSKLPTSEINVDEEFHSEITRLRAIIDGINDSIDEIDGEKKQNFNPNKKPLPTELFDQLLTLNISPRLQYDRVPEHNVHRPYALPLINITRLYLIEMVGGMDDTERDLLLKYFHDLKMPPFFPQVWGPKLVFRPADLSPGEYEWAPQWIGIFNVQGREVPNDEEHAKWMNLATVMKKAPVSSERPQPSGWISL